jgi:N-dimethylarginine dimethylaminohydrolase
LTLPKDETSQIEVSTEYGTLRRVILCPPRYMAIEEAINEVQKQYEDENIDRERAMAQYREFRDTLRAHGAQVIELEPSEDFPEQVFTRDIGFAVGDGLFISRMASEIRQGEEEALEKLLREKGIRYRKLDGGRIEGGDVIVDRGTVYVGVSERTSRDAIRMLSEELPEHEIVPVEFDGKYLHLDCVFNILSPETALIFPEALNPKTVEMLGEKYDLIEVSADEQFTMGTNVLSIGGRKLFSLPVNPEVNRAMRGHGYEVIEIDFTEIIKSGGSFRCCSMPVERS